MDHQDTGFEIKHFLQLQCDQFVSNVLSIIWDFFSTYGRLRLVIWQD